MIYFAGIIPIALSAMAVMEREGFTPGLAEIAEPSQIYIFLYPNTA
jgi:hypothetical protein